MASGHKSDRALAFPRDARDSPARAELFPYDEIAGNPRAPMNLVLGAEQVPLHRDATGTIRIGQTRVTLDTLVSEFHAGATPEQLSQDYPSLALAEIYGAIAFYLRHREEVQGYLAERRAQADELQRQTESRHDPVGVRERLLARRTEG